VGRFLNHSCQPNCIKQPVLVEGDSGLYYHVAFFAAEVRAGCEKSVCVGLEIRKECSCAVAQLTPEPSVPLPALPTPAPATHPSGARSWCAALEHCRSRALVQAPEKICLSLRVDIFASAIPAGEELVSTTTGRRARARCSLMHRLA